MAEPFYVTFTKSPDTHPDLSPRGYAVIEAVSIWDAAEAAGKLFNGQHALIFGTPYWERYTPNYPDGEQLRVTTGEGTVDQLLEDNAPVPRGRLLRSDPGPEISSR